MFKLEGILLSEIAVRLVLAGVLGALVGIERQFHRKPAGLRTIMFITFGAALFTVISEVTSAMKGGDPQRIAAQIIPGIGFIGAGSIIHARGSVMGLTTAATIFVMASIGMACGAGLYWTALFSTALLLVSLLGLRWLEERLHWKPRLIAYSLTTRHLDRTMTELNKFLEHEQVAMQQIRCQSAGGECTLEFSLELPDEQHSRLLQHLAEVEGVSNLAHRHVETE